MKLIDEEEYKNSKEKNAKTNKLLIVAIILTIIIIIAITATIIYLVNNPNKITLKLDGKENDNLLAILDVREEEGKIYAPIKDIAAFLGYEAFNGDYTTVSESQESCYVKNENEVAIFNLESNVIYKLDLTMEDSNYEYCYLEEKIFEKDGKLYTDIQGLEKAFNIAIYYEPEKKKIDIYTLDVFVTDAETKATKKYNYAASDVIFANQKAILDDMIVVISVNELYGVVNYSTGEEILGAQYDNIIYLPEKSAFLVTRNKKMGIISSTGETKIQTEYDSISLLDYENELYLVKKDNLYGVVNINGQTVIYLEYDKIGIDLQSFAQNDIKSGYILQDKLIPVKQGNKWGFFDIEGNKITDIIYDNVGCTVGSKKSATYNVLSIPEYKVIIVGKDKKYTLMGLDGNEKLPCVFDSIYMTISSGERQYFLYTNETEKNITEFVK